MSKLQRGSMYCILALFALLLLSACTEDESGNQPAENEEKEVYEPAPNPEASQISTYNEDRLDEQQDIEGKLMKEYKENTYTLNEPFIKVDPYDASPLSALVMFETEDPVTLKVTSGTKKYEDPIVKVWNEKETSHAIPVLGLYPDTNNKVWIEATNENGETTKSEVVITTEPLPDDFMQTTLIESHPEHMEDGLTYIIPTSGYLFAVDNNADVRWYSSLRSRLIYTRLENGNYLQTTRKEEEDQYNELLELDMIGKVHNAYQVTIDGYDDNNLIHHDVIEMPSGNLLATTHEPDSDYVEDHMHEIDRETGETTQEINLRDIMPEDAPDDYDGKNADSNDWIHQNAIYYDKADQSILVSGRSQDVILKISYPEGELQWILGAAEDWPEEYESYLLEPEGDVKFPAGQHAVKIVDSPETANDPDLNDIILFDNNEVFTRGDRDVSKEYSQAIRYQINEKNRTVEQTWSYGKNRGESFFSHIIGNVQYLNDKNNILLNSGATKDGDSPTGTTGRVVEVDANDDSSGEIFELEVKGKEEDAVKYTYRTWRFPLYPSGEWDFQLENEDI